MKQRPAGAEVGRIRTNPPGPKSRELTKRLRAVECREVTFVSANAPIFLASGAGANLTDVDGNVYVDLTAAFAVASVGHSNPKIVEAVAAQAERLLHGMGDVYPPAEKVELAQTLCNLAPGDGPKRVIFAVTGAEAVEAAIKTAAVASGKPGVLAFEGAYHGLTFGALALTDGEHYRGPFLRQLAGFVRRAPFPRESARSLRPVEEALAGPDGGEIGAIIVEPILGRGGTVPAPDDWLAGLRALCDRRGLILILDEIYTGFGRTGRWFACEHAGVVPDLLCVGKGMAGGFPIAACTGRAEIMDRWPASTGDAVHTSTFIGNPAGCAAALGCIEEIRRLGLVERAAALGARLAEMLEDVRRAGRGRISDVRGRGLMWGLECVDAAGEPDSGFAAHIVRLALERGVIVLAGGLRSNVVQINPPLVITEEQLAFGVRAIRDAIA